MLAWRALGPFELIVGLLRLGGHVVGSLVSRCLGSADTCDLLVEDLVDLVFIDLVTIIIVLVLIRRPLLPKYLEAINRRNISERPILGVQIRIRLEQDIGKAKSKVGTIDIQVLLPGHVHFLAFRAVGLRGNEWPN